MAVRPQTQSIRALLRVNVRPISLIAAVLFSVGLALYLRMIPGEYQELVVFFLILSISCDLVPLPAYPFLIYISHDYPILLIALVGAVAATLSSLFEYHVLEVIFGLERVARIKKRVAYQKFASLFERFSFRSIFLASLVPIPIDPVRILAIGQGYKKWKFALATFLGRIPRFYLIAMLGSKLVHPKRIALILLGLTLLVEVIRRLRRVWTREPALERGL
jgi:ribonucleoside-triphosphate reductase